MDDQVDKLPETPEEWHQYWSSEFEASKKMLRKFWKRGHQVINRFLDERKSDASASTRLNLFHANVSTVQGLMYGQIPRVDVSRRYADPDDDVARVAALILERMLNNCVADPGDDYRNLLKDALQDRLLPGLGVGKVQYKYKSRQDVTPAIEDEEGNEIAPEVVNEIVEDEKSPTLYVNWQDVIWSYSRTWSELRWIGLRSYLTRQEVEERFGEEVAKRINYKFTQPNDTKEGQSDSDFKNPTAQAEVWEIWYKPEKKVYWYSEGFGKILDQQDDPLELSGFWPVPPFLAANVTTTLLVPKADYLLAQDLYNEIDELSTRIELITSAIRVVGVYDKSAEGVQRIFTDTMENELVPVDNWAMFGEKGGLKGVIEWLPVGELVATLNTLREVRDETIRLLHQVTGMSDIMRGQSEQYTSASSDQLKLKFGSARMQNLQEQFAEFATNMMKLKAEIISRHFDLATIVRQSNVDKSMEDPRIIQQALQLVKDPDMLQWKIQVRPESIAMVDYQSLQNERTEYIGAVSMFMQSAAPMIEKMPGSAPVLMQLLKWGLAGFKGSQEIEGVIDRALDEASKPQPQQQQPDPQQIKAQAELQKLQLQGQMQQEKHQFEMQKLALQQKADMQEIMATLQAKLREIEAEADANMRAEQAQAAFNIAELRMKETFDEKAFQRDMELIREKKVDSGSGD